MVKKKDMVNSPEHYTFGGIETLDFIIAKQLGFCEANVVKYVSRAKHKGNELEDLKKAQFYLNKAISQLESRPESYTQLKLKEVECAS